MGKLIVVSNRISQPDTSKNSAGGLAVGILDALKENGGLWFGWNGEISEISGEEEPVSVVEHEGISYASCGLSQNDHDLYYSHYSNMVLWPAFHYRLDLVNYSRNAWDGYLRVNKQFAEKLEPFIEQEDTIWVHDYHLLPFAQALKDRGHRQPIGFFLHIPFPAPEVFSALPDHGDLIKMATAYDLLGFQTAGDVQSFLSSVDLVTELTSLGDNTYQAFGHTFRVNVYPIGIDPENIQSTAAGPLPPKMQAIKQELGDAKNIIACERLDYTKGLPDRFLAYEYLLEHYPDQRGNIRYTQIAPTSRGDVCAYQDIRHKLETEAGRINGKYGTMSWTPLYYLNQHFDRRLLLKIFRSTDIALITPLRDGMNLVAKEYIAAQNPENPGVLILSRFAGAADELKTALIVNPYDHAEVANAIHKAVTMPLDERKSRYQAMMQRLKQYTIVHWRDNFLQDLFELSNN